MPGVKSLVGLAFLGSIALLLLFLACGLYSNWWPFLVTLFYVLAPLPTLYYQGHRSDMLFSFRQTGLHDLSCFLTTGIVLSAFCLPVLLARAPIAAPLIHWGATGLVMAANVVMFLTIGGFFGPLAPREEAFFYGQEW